MGRKEKLNERDLKNILDDLKEASDKYDPNDSFAFSLYTFMAIGFSSVPGMSVIITTVGAIDFHMRGKIQSAMDDGYNLFKKYYDWMKEEKYEAIEVEIDYERISPDVYAPIKVELTGSKKPGQEWIYNQ